MLAKLIFIVQLFVSWFIVVFSMLWASWKGRGADDCTNNGNCAWWVVSDSGAILIFGEMDFALTVGAAFLVSFEGYLNAKARGQL